MELTHLSLFSGIGGDSLAAEWAGFKTVCFVEIHKYRQQVLHKHWPDVPIIEDVRDVTKEKVMAYATESDARFRQGQQEGKESIDRQPAQLLSDTGSRGREPMPRNHHGGVRTRAIPPITLITGGFPCQPVSVAGKRRGKADDRWLWPEMLRVVQEVRPTWVVGENVAGIIRMELDNCISDLEGIGYSCQAFVIPACAVNAPHRRNRVFIVAYTHERTRNQRVPQPSKREVEGCCQDVADTEGRQDNGRGRGILGMPERQRGRINSPIDSSSQDVADTSESGLEIRSEPTNRRGIVRSEGSSLAQGSWWATEPDVGRVAHGIPSRVDRLAALGDAVVPQQVYPILKVIADIELAKK